MVTNTTFVAKSPVIITYLWSLAEVHVHIHFGVSQCKLMQFEISGSERISGPHTLTAWELNTYVYIYNTYYIIQNTFWGWVGQCQLTQFEISGSERTSGPQTLTAWELNTYIYIYNTTKFILGVGQCKLM